jgi:2-oxo-4-hydroxy-4-carboxy--5-ureidoimidazoline (OHCU) decarboxylase
LNDAYKEKFGFPFVMAVRGSSCEEILELFSKRLKNNYEVEFETALAEIHKIARLRLGAIEKDA